MVAEWVLSVGRNWWLWRRSAWHLGLVLAAISYVLLAEVSPDAGLMILMGLTIPVTLTWLANRRHFPQPQIATWLSLVALIALQPWTWLISLTRLVTLGVATGLMLLNTRQIPRVVMAVHTVGFSLAFVWAAIWQARAGDISLELGINLLAGAVLTLWLLRSGILKYLATASSYGKAMDGWAIALCSSELILLTWHSLEIYWRILPAAPAGVLAVAITIGAIAYRGWRLPTDWIVYSLGWSLELLTAEVLGFTDGVIYLAIANVVLGLMTQLTGDWWQRRAGMNHLPNSWHVMPLFYGALGVALRWGTFQMWTGWSTLGVALIAIGVGRRQAEFKPLVYLAMIGVSLSAYEILLYQFSQMPGALGDRFIAMTVLGTSLLYAYRVLSPWLSHYLVLTESELKVAAHLHWALSSCFLSMAVFSPLKSSGLMGLGAGVFLTRYAIMQGRSHSRPKESEFWVYVGIIEGTAIGIYALHTWIGQDFFRLLVPWGPALSAVVAYFFYTLPWQSWGWPLQPWQRSALVLPLVDLGVSLPTLHHCFKALP